MDTDKAIPTNYAEWRECITVHCGIPLTLDYITERLNALSQVETEETIRFRRLYGDQHWRDVIHWFRQAKRDLSPAPNATRDD
jgi:hypothetical protein